MAGEITLTVVGNLTADPEHKLLPSGQTVANLTVAQNSRVYDRASNEWRDGAAVFMRCSVWGDMADHVAASLAKGMRVIVTGRMRQRSYEDRNGVTQWITELMVDDIAVSLRFTTAEVHVRDAGEDEQQPSTRRGGRALVGAAAGAGDQPDF
ncbi:single-stranded DNA-binding protein [Nocardia uniformis]|uniref:Single-stranded DNA-binding protein n=1 Tax=Nocardia uniformis TaxID=53432 RepID=A0A849C7S9_9NOCA|nr:single-stranded DNA-binding protein [Nocardia uniformis]NNH73798.1 single-stranded DNA-binding protein [Nocardia uniformis]